ncbi:16S rRNA (uracil(1498)-N(3))-methyltransferase [Desulfofundulus thermosubterraneus]|uniref:16S rRNA (uracil(1498)-N(3))-methyltransferase n=1 Tax=Desulfofundulus thermosubterraneus TaxID=348840 RepID=UPI000A0169E4
MPAIGYFFVSPEQIAGERVTITGPDVVHISRVLRLGSRDVITVMDGQGRGYRVRLAVITGTAVEGVILEQFVPGGEAPLKVTLVQGLSKGDKMDIIIQKSTELGVSCVVPLACRRSVVRLTSDKARERQQRWQRIALEAAKQSRRAIVPRVTGVMDLPAALNLITPGALALMPWEEERELSLKAALKGRSCGEVFVFIGPEGGFEADEVAMARERGVFSVSLGPRILRTETAGLATLTMVLYELGDLGGHPAGTTGETNHGG